MNEPRPDDHLGPAVGDGVQGGEALEDADRIVGAEDGHGRAEPDPLGLPGDRRQHHLGRRDGEVVAVVLADADEVEADLVGQHGLRDDVADHLVVRQELSVRVGGHVAERVQAEFDCLRHAVAAFRLC